MNETRDNKPPSVETGPKGDGAADQQRKVSEAAAARPSDAIRNQTEQLQVTDRLGQVKSEMGQLKKESENLRAEKELLQGERKTIEHHWSKGDGALSKEEQASKPHVEKRDATHDQAKLGDNANRQAEIDYRQKQIGEKVGKLEDEKLKLEHRHTQLTQIQNLRAETEMKDRAEAEKRNKKDH